MMHDDAALLVRQAYLAWLQHDLSLLPIIPIKNSDRVTRLELRTVYVPLRIMAHSEPELRSDPQSPQPASQPRRKADAAEGKAARDERVLARFGQVLPAKAPAQSITRLLLLGNAGSGKTTTLHYAALSLAATLLGQVPLDDQLGLNLPSPPLPIYLRLTLVVKWLFDAPEGRQCAATPEPLLAWIDQQVAPKVRAWLAAPPSAALPLPSPQAWDAAVERVPLTTLVRQGGCLLLLDGLDETGDHERREQVQAWITALAQACPANFYLVASRPFGGITLPDFVEQRLSPLNAAEMQQLLHQWVTAAYANKSAERGQARGVAAEVGYLWDILERSPRLFEMCTNPLLLTSVALLVYTGVGLPRERAELYSRLLYLLLETWRVLQLSGGHLPTTQAERPELFSQRTSPSTTPAASQSELFRESVSSVQSSLQLLAYRMQDAELREATEAQLVDWLAPEYVHDMGWSTARARRYVTDLLETLASHSGLIQRRDLGYSFAHYTLQEYLTARYYSEQPTGVQQLLALAAKQRWRETILLAVGHWATNTSDVSKAREFLERLLAQQDPDALLLLLAGAALDDADAGRVRHLARVRNEIITRLHACAALTNDWRDKAHPDPVVRNQAASLLDRLEADEARPGLDLAAAEYWAETIAPGTFSMGDDNGSWDAEKPQFDFTISHPYALARFPVTNRQYLRFTEALAGRGTPEAIQAAKQLLDLMQKHKQTAEEFHPRYWLGARYRAGEGNHPVVGVNWYAATAFAWWVDAWLRGLGLLSTSELVRLPSEAEWERAAAYPVALGAAMRSRGALNWLRQQLQPREQDTGMRSGRREYPWGMDLTTAVKGSITTSIQANIDASKIGGTSVVGIFPHGAAACGAQDMAGNVWEWCSTPFQNYGLPQPLAAESLYTANKSPDSSYVLRGGTWYYVPAVARAAFRVGYPPASGSGNYGFRLARLFSLP